MSVASDTITGMALIDERHIGELAVEHGVPEAVADEMTGQLRPCVYLVQHEDLSRKEDARPAARTGGLPELPTGVDWPSGREPLVLTIDCAELPRDVLDFPLPADGQLLIFTDMSYPPDSSAVLHVPTGVPTTEHSATYTVDGQAWETTVHEPRRLYPVTGLTIGPDWSDLPETEKFLDGDPDNEELLDRFEDAVVHGVHGEPRSDWIQLGGYSRPWQMPPDADGLILLAQIQGDAVKYGIYTLNLVVGTREDIAAGRFENLEYEQQY
ncbi:hypothetical protein M2283_005397 [Streptomyces pseudovenezuelae]|uniref:DUF1963 domain-containing protein n=2 Tax=Streptomyces pseudovenezuelae TaxID=67350 RepID=A0ABT6LQ40_9ACTN|nr:hypothetical protein [Streptomyces pseudovenezuelae]